MRTAFITVVFAAFVFSAWQLMVSSPQRAGQPSVSIPMIPTPSAQSTSTRVGLENCELLLYTVRPGETLDSIAQKFAVAKEEIMTLNQMNTENITNPMDLNIRVCNFTPTGTAEGSAASTTTYTPAIRPTTSTPDG